MRTLPIFRHRNDDVVFHLTWKHKDATFADFRSTYSNPAPVADRRFPLTENWSNYKVFTSSRRPLLDRFTQISHFVFYVNVLNTECCGKLQHFAHAWSQPPFSRASEIEYIVFPRGRAVQNVSKPLSLGGWNTTDDVHGSRQILWFFESRIL